MLASCKRSCLGEMKWAFGCAGKDMWSFAALCVTGALFVVVVGLSLVAASVFLTVSFRFVGRWSAVCVRKEVCAEMEMESHGGLESWWGRLGTTKKTAHYLQHGHLSARRELQSHPLAGQAQACGRLTKRRMGRRARRHLSWPLVFPS